MDGKSVYARWEELVFPSLQFEAEMKSHGFHLHHWKTSFYTMENDVPTKNTAWFSGVSVNGEKILGIQGCDHDRNRTQFPKWIDAIHANNQSSNRIYTDTVVNQIHIPLTLTPGLSTMFDMLSVLNIELDEPGSLAECVDALIYIDPLPIYLPYKNDDENTRYVRTIVKTHRQAFSDAVVDAMVCLNCPESDKLCMVGMWTENSPIHIFRGTPNILESGFSSAYLCLSLTTELVARGTIAAVQNAVTNYLVKLDS